MHFWKLSYSEYLELPSGLFAEMVKYMKKHRAAQAKANKGR